MLQTERVNDSEEALRISMNGHQAEIWTALPAIIQSFDANKLTCTAQPAIKGLLRATDGTTSWITLPLLVDVPVCFPRGGGCTLTFPIAAGDEALIVFSSRCIDAWWSSGGIQVQSELRMHDLSDGFAIPGPFSQATKIGGFSTTATQLRSNDGTTYVELNPTGKVVNVVAPGGMTITSPTLTITGIINVQNVQGAPTASTISGSMTATGTVTGQTDVVGGGKSLKGHIHGDPQGGNTTPPL